MNKCTKLWIETSLQMCCFAITTYTIIGVFITGRLVFGDILSICGVCILYAFMLATVMKDNE